MFQGDRDHDTVSEFYDEVGVSIDDEPEKLTEARAKLDAGQGAKLMKECRDRQKGWKPFPFDDPKYKMVILAAYMMQLGAKISPEDRSHLLEILPSIESRPGYAMPLGDEGFRDPGKAQFKAALDLYVDGQPRDFFAPRLVLASNPNREISANMICSCYNCGKTSADLASISQECDTHLKTCSRCLKHQKKSYYCGRECQKENWKSHKAICKPPMQMMGMASMNV